MRTFDKLEIVDPEKIDWDDIGFESSILRDNLGSDFDECHYLYKFLDITARKSFLKISDKNRNKQGGVTMGMTDRQFDAYQEELLENLRSAREELRGIETVKLDKIISNIEKRLSRP